MRCAQGVRPRMRDSKEGLDVHCSVRGWGRGERNDFGMHCCGKHDSVGQVLGVAARASMDPT